MLDNDDPDAAKLLLLSSSFLVPSSCTTGSRCGTRWRSAVPSGGASRRRPAAGGPGRTCLPGGVRRDPLRVRELRAALPPNLKAHHPTSRSGPAQASTTSSRCGAVLRRTAGRSSSAPGPPSPARCARRSARFAPTTSSSTTSPTVLRHDPGSRDGQWTAMRTGPDDSRLDVGLAYGAAGSRGRRRVGCRDLGRTRSLDRLGPGGSPRGPDPRWCRASRPPATAPASQHHVGDVTLVHRQVTCPRGGLDGGAPLVTAGRAGASGNACQTPW